MNMVIAGQMVETKKIYLNHVAEVKNMGRKGGGLGFLVVGPRSKQAMVCLLVKAKEQNI
jgi:hypothetical protein